MAIRHLQAHLQRYALVTIYMSFVRPHLEYRDNIIDQPHNESFCQKIESIQYKVGLTKSGQTSLILFYKNNPCMHELLMLITSVSVEIQLKLQEHS